jgi:hypothetical protein
VNGILALRVLKSVGLYELKACGSLIASLMLNMLQIVWIA